MFIQRNEDFEIDLYEEFERGSTPAIACAAWNCHLQQRTAATARNPWRGVPERRSH
jgi:hypothetical protein